MDPAGTLRFTTATLDPYLHRAVGFQIASPVFISLRQTSEVSSLTDEPDALYPGIDLKFRLLKETRSRPEIAVGMQSAFGHKRMAGEYIAASKRWRNFDFTAGMGWGRFGSAGHFDNPLKGLGHFGGARDNENNGDGDSPNTPDDWFTGNDAGFFAGVEYQTPWQDISLKLDYGADRYEAERAAFNYDRPAPWSAAAVLSPTDWMSLSVGVQGTDKVMARLSLQGSPEGWPFSKNPKDAPPHFRAYRTAMAQPAAMEVAAQKSNMVLYDAGLDGRETAQTKLQMHNRTSGPQQIGRAARHMSNEAGPLAEELIVAPRRFGLKGPSVKLLRRDFEQALGRNAGSPQEIWHNAQIVRDKTWRWPVFSPEAYEDHAQYKTPRGRLILDNRASLSEQDSTALYRSALIAEFEGLRPHRFLHNGFGLRLNLADNLDRLADIRPQALTPIRSDIDKFAKRGIAVERAFTTMTHSFRDDMHLALSLGYLEEMFAGFGGEFLYRPIGPRFAIGAESWAVAKRDPDSALNLGLESYSTASALVNIYYDAPHWDTTLKASFGRYLGQDTGAGLEMSKRFDNGATLSAFVRVSDQSDFDATGGETHAHHGIRLSLPLGGSAIGRLPFVGRDSEARFSFGPMGRDTAQRLDNPFPLYEETRPLAYSEMVKEWTSIVE